MNSLFYRSGGVALLPALMFCLLAACSDEPTGVDALNIKTVILPNGTKVLCEVMIRPEDMARGMMHRDQLPPKRGLFFVHDRPGPYPYWMHNVKVPLDIIWISPDRRIAEISAGTPPCLKEPEQCPNYGGRAMAQYVLEMAAGSAKLHGLKPGDPVNW